MKGATIEAFQSFVANARALVGKGAGPVKEPLGDNGVVSDQEQTGVKQFKDFVDEARLLATDFACRYLEWFEPHAKRIRKLPPMPDLIDIAGHTHVENCYTRLVAWALGKNNASNLARDVQSCWLRSLGFELAADSQHSVTDQIALDSGGILDLLLTGENSSVAVEVKTVSREHDVAETREKQTIHYPREVRKQRGDNSDVDVHMVFLTMAGDLPENGEAVPTTFTMLALAILEAVEASGAPDAEAWPYYALASHWIERAIPKIQLRNFVRDYSSNTTDYRQLLKALPEFNQLGILVPMGERVAVMTEFKFSELASLYLNNLEVVNTAKRVYEGDCDRLVESLEKAIAKLSTPETFNAKTKTPWQLWWLGKGPPEDAYLYLRRHEPDYINHHGILLYACTARRDQATLDALTELVKIDALALTGLDDPTKDCVFQVEIRLAGDNFINETAQRVAAILQAMHKAVASIASTDFASS